ncbi:MAG: DUF2786 domain-containing protein [Oscillospiraceae bacterium]|nr:DUF2786 domain-containing protein [Oscillospiraceae bacterium]
MIESIATPNSIKDTITKLLALASSPNENEARAALLKARELMAKHKLRQTDVERSDTAKVIDRLTRITCTKIINAWVTRLSVIIAENYCCKSYYNRMKRAKKVTIGLIGLEDDIDICERIIEYAFDCVVSECRRIRRQHRNDCAPSTIRQIENAYGYGFCEGVKQA